MSQRGAAGQAKQGNWAANSACGGSQRVTLGLVSEEGAPGTDGQEDYSGLPGVHLSIDQIAAYNMRRWRKAAGMTQEELGQRVGWTFKAVSAAEATWRRPEGGRKFDAATLAALSAALEVPLPALLLPPPDDGIVGRYLYEPLNGTCVGMAGLLSMILSDPDEDDDSPVMAAYRDAYAEAVGRYLDPGVGSILVHLGSLTGEQLRAKQAERLRMHRAALVALLDDLDRAATSITGEP